MAEKKPKIGPREARLREMREERAARPARGKTKRRAKAILKFVAKKRARG